MADYTIIEAGEPWLCIARDTQLEVYYKGERREILEGFIKITALMIVDDTVFVSDAESVMVIDLNTYAKKLLLNGVVGCRGFEFIHTNLFMALSQADQLAVVNIDTFHMQVIASKEQGLSTPNAIAFDDDRLWILNSQSSSLSYMLGRELFKESMDATLNHPLDMALGRYRDGCGAGRLFISDTGNDQIKVYNPEDKSLQVLVEDIKKPASITKSGCKLYVTSLESDDIYMYDLKSMKLEILELQ